MKKMMTLIVMVLLGVLGAVFADSGNALVFDGIDDYVNVGNDASFDVGNVLTIEAWIRADDLSSRQGIFSTRYGNDPGAFQLEVGGASGGSGRVAVSGFSTWVAESGDAAISSNVWTHIAYVRSNVSNQVLYVNGTALTLNQESTAYSFADNTADKVIASGTSGGQLFDGAIDELRVWNIARSAGEIAASTTNELTGTESGLVACWEFNNGSLADASTNGNDGVTAGDSPVHYASLSGGHIWPYDSWASAATNIQAAVDTAAAGDTVRVADGTYLLSSEIAIDAAITVESLNGPGAAIIDGQGACRGFNLGTSACTVSGFTVTNGYTSGRGGAVYCTDTTPAITNCVLTGCYADDDGGAVAYGTLNHCELTGNTAADKGGASVYGELNHCTISRNTAQYGGGSCNGTLNDCTISDNTADYNGGGIHGGTLYNCEITGNTADDAGGGVYGSTLYNCTISNNDSGVGGGGVRACTLYNCLITGNICDDGDVGGGGSDLSTLYNCTLVGNTAFGSGGSHLDTLYNCIIWGNTATYAQGCDNIRDSTCINVCAPEGSDGVTHGVNGCITSDPLFIDSAYRLRGGSPCYNAGTNAYATGSSDLDGAARIMDATVDMGCYELLGAADGDATPIHYVSPAGAGVWPYTSWADAATNIQDAVVAAAPGDRVLVTNGVYAAGGTVPHGQDYTNRVVIRKAVDVQSVNGAESTFIVGASDGGTNGPAAVRCVWLSDGSLSGFTVTNGYTQIEGDWGFYRRGGGVNIFGSDGAVSNCVISGCSASVSGGGVDMRYGGTLVDCTIENNICDTDTYYGGGGVCLYDGSFMDRCIVRNNQSVGDNADGGGLSFSNGGEARNCLISGNSADDTGGGVSFRSAASNAVLQSCTVVDNTATNSGGGLVFADDGTALNCIVWANSAAADANCAAGSASIRYTCSTPKLSGTGNISNDPLLVGSLFQLDSGSPCIDAGSDPAWADNAIDLIGNTRSVNYWVDLGCTEGIGTHVTGPSPTHYVSLSGGNVWPYTSWADAATNIQFAADAADDGDTVLVTNGTYNVGRNRGPMDIGSSTESRVLAVRSFILRGTGPDTVIEGSDNLRCIYLSNGATLEGFTLTGSDLWLSGGFKEGGGGVFIEESGTVSNCVFHTITNNTHGGGVLCYYGGTVSDCTFSDNVSGTYGGGVFCYFDGMVSDCTFSGNSGQWGGGVYLYEGGTVTDCTLTNNTATANQLSGGGAYCYKGGTVSHCRIEGNTAQWAGGGVCLYEGGTVENCLILNNSSSGYVGGGVHLENGGTVRNCTIIGNSADGGGGVCNFDGTVENCIVYDNSATDGNTYGHDIYHESGAETGTNLFTCASDGITDGVNGCTTDDPDLWAGYMPGPASPCVDSGTNSLSGTDLAGSVRIQGGTIDLGCYERASTVHAGDSPIHYVSLSGGNIWPYTNWTDAATVPQDAIDAALDGDTVLVADGTYAAGGLAVTEDGITNRIALVRDITVEGSGAVIEGAGPIGGSAVRCAWLNGGTLSGVTLSDGHTYDASDYQTSSTEKAGGGAWLHFGGTISNCTVTGCGAQNYGGGVYCYDGGTVVDTQVENCSAGSGGGVSMIQGGSVERCILSGNSATGSGGGAKAVDGGTVRNSLLVGNAAENYGGGGFYADNGGELHNCTVVDNTATSGSGGGIYAKGWSGGMPDIRNCIAWNNTAPSDANLYDGGDVTISHSSYTADPQLTAAYRLGYGSTCIDAGSDIYAVGPDLDRAERFIGTVDMGAYEYDATTTDTDGDAYTDEEEYIADTNPTNAADFFQILEIDGSTVSFESSDARLYTLLSTTNLVGGQWSEVGSEMGAGGLDSMSGTNDVPQEFYKLEVALP